MKKYLIAISMLMSLVARAYDFSAQVPGGQTLYFNVIEGGVEVVFPNTATNPWLGSDVPSGALIIPSTVTSGSTTYAVLRIGMKALYGTDITSLVIENGVTEIGNNSFARCSFLGEITLPASLTALNISAFASDSALTDVYMQGSTPPTNTHVNAFYQTPLSSCTLHVPSGALANYSGLPWDNFGFVSDGHESATLTLAATDPSRGSVSGAGTYATGTNVTLTATPVAPYRFACWSDGDTLNPRILTLLQDLHLAAVFQLPVRDTMVVFHVDTLRLTDTVVVRVHDTVEVHDTTYLFGTDTLYRTDTVLVQPTFYRLQVLSDNASAGIGIGNALLPAGTEAEVGALPLEGYRFLSWDDGSTDNPRRLTLAAATTLTARFETLALPPSAESEWSVRVMGRQVEVSCHAGSIIKVYDLEGRLVATLTAQAAPTRLQLAAAGTYIVQVDNQAGRKIVIK